MTLIACDWLCVCLQLHFLLKVTIQIQLSSTPTISEPSSPLSVVGHNMCRKNTFSELLVLDIPQTGNSPLCKHISSAQTLTSFLSRQDRDSFMLPGLWSPLVLTSVLWQAHRAGCSGLHTPGQPHALSSPLSPCHRPWNRDPLPQVQSRKTLCFSSYLISVIVPNSTNTKNPEGNRNKSYLTLNSPILRTGGYWQKFESHLRSHLASHCSFLACSLDDTGIIIHPDIFSHCSTASECPRTHQ